MSQQGTHDAVVVGLDREADGDGSTLGDVDALERGQADLGHGDAGGGLLDVALNNLIACGTHNARCQLSEPDPRVTPTTSI